MGHATHFLQRLDRVSDGQVELALTLYRDEALLREVLSRASLPDGAERLAISLEHPEDGPFVVVTREGRFVTCLAAGMRARDLPLVTREQLDNAAARVERMRERLARVQQLRESGAESEASLRFRRMQQQGPRFAREDAQTLLQVMPLIEPVCCHLLVDLVLEMEQRLKRLARIRLDDPRRLSSAKKEQVLAFGDMAWSSANLIALVTPRALQRTFEVDGGPPPPIHDLAYLTSTCGTLAHTTRALRFIARGGKPALAEAKSHRRKQGDLHSHIWRELAVGAIGVASSKLRAEASKALSFDSFEEPTTLENVYESTSGLFGRVMHATINHPERNDDTFLTISRSFVAGVVGGHGTERPPQEEIDAVPEDVARAAWLTTAISLHESSHISSVLMLPLEMRWIVSASPDELFLPTAWARRVLPPRGVEEVMFWLRPMLRAYGLSWSRKRPITRAAPKAGRNDPCPCGSGKKHKRCCA